jgi:hypothetical protein
MFLVHFVGLKSVLFGDTPNQVQRDINVKDVTELLSHISIES